MFWKKLKDLKSQKKLKSKASKVREFVKTLVGFWSLSRQFPEKPKKNNNSGTCTVEERYKQLSEHCFDTSIAIIKEQSVGDND